jgi:murein DD-endopeptidase
MKMINKFCFSVLCLCFICIQNVAVATSKNDNKNLEKAYIQLFKKAPAKKISRQARAVNSNKKAARLNAIKVAKKQIHKKYRWGGTSPRTGFDCSGLMQYAYKTAKINLPRTAAEQYKFTKRISLAKLMVGDLIFFHTRRTRARVNHVGIYLGGGKFIHSPRRGKKVSIASLSKYWRRKAVGAGRV